MKTETYKGLFAMHKYWGKKPFEQLDYFVKKYSKKDDVVLDSFCGSGVTLVEALRLGRNAVGIDLNPIAIKLTHASLQSVDLKRLKSTFEDIKKKVRPTIDSLYLREFNGEKTLTTHIVWKGNKIDEVWCLDPNGKKKIRKADKVDYEMSNNPSVPPKWYPDSLMFENSRINVCKDQKVSDLFTKRALVGLSLILDEIKHVDDEAVREALELTFTGAISQASKLVFVIRRRGKAEKATLECKPEVGSWVIGYWVPEEHFEIHSWNCFENRFKRILKGKEDVNSFSKKFNNDYKLILGSATEIPLDDNSVDYVFIDPPHANRILYMEQSLMWNAWLGLDKNIQWEKEIIVSESKGRNKDLDSYSSLLNESFVEIRRVLKKDKYLSFAFNCFDDETWIKTLNLFINNGFEFVEIEPLEYSAHSVVQDNRKNGLKTDFVFTCINSNNLNQKEIYISKDIDGLKAMINDIKKTCKSIEVYDLINRIFKKTIPQGYIYSVEDISKLS